MSRYDHKIETSLEGIEHLSKEKGTRNDTRRELRLKRWLRERREGAITNLNKGFNRSLRG